MRGIFSKLNISKALLTRGASLVVVFATLVAAYAALSMNHTLGWFAKNETVSANGMITQAYAAKLEVTVQQVVVNNGQEERIPFETIKYNSVTKNEAGEVTKTQVIDTGDMLANVKVPGQSITFEITITNVGIYDVDLTGVGLEAPGVDGDVPKVVDGTSYYLSTQLNTWLKGATVTKADGTESTLTVPEGTKPDDDKDSPDYLTGAKFLRDSNGSNRINYLDWFDDDSTTVTLSPKESVTFTIVVHFKDNGGNQNVYKNFGELGENGAIVNGQCKRPLFITFDE